MTTFCVKNYLLGSFIDKNIAFAGSPVPNSDIVPGHKQWVCLLFSDIFTINQVGVHVCMQFRLNFVLNLNLNLNRLYFLLPKLHCRDEFITSDFHVGIGKEETLVPCSVRALVTSTEKPSLCSHIKRLQVIQEFFYPSHIRMKRLETKIKSGFVVLTLLSQGCEPWRSPWYLIRETQCWALALQPLCQFNQQSTPKTPFDHSSLQCIMTCNIKGLVGKWLLCMQHLLSQAGKKLLVLYAKQAIESWGTNSRREVSLS